MDDDIFDQDGALTAAFLLARGYCCGNGCRNCPYIPRHGGQMARPRGDSDAAPAAPCTPEAAGSDRSVS